MPCARPPRSPISARWRRAQRTLATRLAVSIPAARIGWHYGVALDGVSVVLPASELARLRALPGATVWPTVTYHALPDIPASSAAATADPGPSLIGATALWGQNLANAGQGLKIGLLDDGIDQAHPYFKPSGFSYPAGFPKGNRAYTTPKVIVARAFPSPSVHWKNADKPFDPVYSDHATHVAGIAAGDYETPTAPNNGSPISGVAPKAYLGNYKVYTVPTADYGLDGNSPEIAKGIDQAVADGMNVLNLSFAEPEVEPRRDIVVQALDNAAAAGVVPVVCAGNDYDIGGLGTIGSPGNAPAAITVAASTMGNDDGTAVGPPRRFLVRGPDPRLAPAEAGRDGARRRRPVLRSPARLRVAGRDEHGGAARRGRCGAAPPASPHVDGAAGEVGARLDGERGPPHRPLRRGLGVTRRRGPDQPRPRRPAADLHGSDLTRLGASPARVLGHEEALDRRRRGRERSLARLDPRAVAAARREARAAGEDARGRRFTRSAAQGLGGAQAGDGTGFVVLTRGADVRRVAFWFHVEVPRLGLDPHRILHKPGLYHGDTAGKASHVSSYRYPQRGLAEGVPTRLGGPEQVFRFTLRRRVANFGVAVGGQAPGIRVSPRLVADDDENRVVGYTGMPAALNPFQGFYRAEPVVGAVLPDPGTYEFVFDTPTHAKPGRFTFRFWVDDTSPPSIRLLQRRDTIGRPIRVAVGDSGSGVDPHSLRATVGGKRVRFAYAHGVLRLRTGGLRPGRQVVRVTASDYQETKNTEDVGPVLPNTRVLRATVTLAARSVTLNPPSEQFAPATRSRTRHAPARGRRGRSSDRGGAAGARRRSRRLGARDGGPAPCRGTTAHAAERGPGQPTRRDRGRGPPGRSALRGAAGSTPADRGPGTADAGATDGVA